MTGEAERSVVLNGQVVKYCLERKQVKNLNLRIRKDGRVFVSADKNVSVEEIDNFVCSKVSYILDSVSVFEKMAQYKQQVRMYVSGETFYIQGRAVRLKVSCDVKDSVICDGVYIYLNVKSPEDVAKKARLVNRFLKQECRRVFDEIVDELYPVIGKYGIEKPILRIRKMETQWGSCLAKKGIITLNTRLLEAPRNCIEYVVMHELCHFVHANHSKRFYQFLTMLMPDWKERKQNLDKIATFWL